MFLSKLVGGDAFINQWSLVPAEIVAGRGWITILTAMFMHAGTLAECTSLATWYSSGLSVQRSRM
jgi:membrane associated rhomboid family serine protease